MVVSKFHRTDGFRIVDPKEVKGLSPREKVRDKIARKRAERKMLKDYKDEFIVQLNVRLQPKEKGAVHLINMLEKQLLTDLLKQFDNNIQVVANCFNTGRNNIWLKIKEYNIEVADV